MKDLYILATTDIKHLRQAWFTVQYSYKTPWYDLLLEDGLGFFVWELAEEVIRLESA